MSEPKISEESERLIVAVIKQTWGTGSIEKLRAHIAALENKVTRLVEDGDEYCEQIAALESEVARLRAAQEWRPIVEYNLGGQPVLTSRLVALGAAVETQFPPFLPNTTHFRVCPKGVLPPPPKSEPRAAESAKE